MQGGVGRVDVERLIRHNFWSLPPSISHVEVDFEHVVSLDSANGIDMIRAWFLFQLLPRVVLQIARQERLLHRGEAHHWQLCQACRCLSQRVELAH